MKIGNALREIRKAVVCRRQQEVAKAIGLSQTYLSQIETGDKIPSQEVLEKLCAEYKVPLPIVVWKGIESKDVAKNKRVAFNRIKPIVDDLLEGFLINNF